MAPGGHRDGKPFNRSGAVPNAATTAAATVASRNRTTRGMGLRPFRNGNSTNFQDSVATPSDKRMHMSFAILGDAPLPKVDCMPWNTMIGQCHRYSEYEIKPMETNGLNESARMKRVSPDRPAQITRAVPRHGRRAEAPGNGVTGV